MTFWSRYAAVYDLIWNSPTTDRIRAAVIEASADARVVIDLGCGTGLLDRGRVAAGVEVIGVDTDPAMLARAAGSARVSRTELAPAERTGLPDASADAVVIGALLHLHPTPRAVLDEARRLLRPGGVIVVTSPRPALSPRLMLAIDLANGRGRLDAWRADILRRAVNVLAVAAGGLVAARDRGREPDVLGIVRSVESMRIEDLGIVAGAQHVVMLRPSS